MTSYVTISSEVGWGYQPRYFAFLIKPFQYHRNEHAISIFVWWFETFFIFPYIGNSKPNRLIFFRGIETTNQIWLLYNHLKQSTAATSSWSMNMPNSLSNVSIEAVQWRRSTWWEDQPTLRATQPSNNSWGFEITWVY